MYKKYLKKQSKVFDNNFLINFDNTQMKRKTDNHRCNTFLFKQFLAYKV